MSRLGETSPRYQPVEGQLLNAMTLEALGRDVDAAREYAALVTHAPGEEVRCRYAMLLQRRGDRAQAKALFDEVLTRSRRAPAITGGRNANGSISPAAKPPDSDHRRPLRDLHLAEIGLADQLVAAQVRGRAASTTCPVCNT